MIYKEINNSKNRWIVLIHCVCGTENIFKYQMDMLSKYYNLIIVRLAGHGVASKNVEASIDYTVDEIYKYVQEKNQETEYFAPDCDHGFSSVPFRL